MPSYGIYTALISNEIFIDELVLFAYHKNNICHLRVFLNIDSKFKQIN